VSGRVSTIDSSREQKDSIPSLEDPRCDQSQQDLWEDQVMAPVRQGDGAFYQCANSNANSIQNSTIQQLLELKKRETKSGRQPERVQAITEIPKSEARKLTAEVFQRLAGHRVKPSACGKTKIGSGS